MSRWRALALLLPCIACGAEPLPPAGQLVLHVDTDAPLPPPPGEQPAPFEPPALFDRLSFEVFETGADQACEACTREIEVDTVLLREGRASFGIVPDPGVEGIRVRVRLFPARSVRAFGPPAPVTVESVVRLPAVAHDGIVDVHVSLSTDDVGVPRGTLALPEPVLLGSGEASRVGTWPGAARVPCAGAPAAGEVCIPGGAFFMGDPLQGGLGDGTDSDRQRLVVLSPFWLGASEVTVADARATALGQHVQFWNPGGSPFYDADWWCTYSPDAGVHDALPLDCVAFSRARSFCQDRGGDLPTETQWEYAAGGTVGNRYPWGNDSPTCEGAVWGRGGYALMRGTPDPCRHLSSIEYLDAPAGGVELPGTGTLDRVDFEGGTLLDLAGNLEEWTRDFWNRQDEPCWSAPGIYRDPVCETPSTRDAGSPRTVRGGSWTSDSTLLRAGSRNHRATDATAGSMAGGFRCARPAAG